MKMKKSLLVLCLSAGLLASLPPFALADINIVPQDTSAAPAIQASALQQLTWTPVNIGKSQTTTLATTGQTLNVPGLSGPVAAWSVPANAGELTITLTSDASKDRTLFAPNVLVFDQAMRPAAYFPGRHFTYREPGVMSADRLEGTLRLTPALGQQKLYLLAFTTESDLRQTTKMTDPAKAYAKGTGNAVPDIPDPIARHVTDGKLTLKVKSATGGSILVGPLFGSSDNSPVTVSNTATPVYSAPAPVSAPTSAPVAAPTAATGTAVVAPAPAAKSEPMLNDTERYFNQAIKQAIARGDVDKALKLLNEAERLGSTSARSVFISSVKGKG